MERSCRRATHASDLHDDRDRSSTFTEPPNRQGRAWRLGETSSNNRKEAHDDDAKGSRVRNAIIIGARGHRKALATVLASTLSSASRLGAWIYARRERDQHCGVRKAIDVLKPAEAMEPSGLDHRDEGRRAVRDQRRTGFSTPLEWEPEQETIAVNVSDRDGQRRGCAPSGVQVAWSNIVNRARIGNRRLWPTTPLRRSSDYLRDCYRFAVACSSPSPEVQPVSSIRQARRKVLV